MWVVYTISITSTPCHHTHHSDGVGAAGAGSHSVQIFDSNVDNTMTLCCLRRPSGCPPDYTQYMCNTGRRNDIQYVQVTCPMIFEPLPGFPMSDIGYPIESDRRTASDKLYITQLLPTRYSINVTNTFGGYQYNKQ